MHKPSQVTSLSKTYPRPQNPIRPRAIVIGLILVIANTYWIGIESEVWYSLFTLVNPFLNAIFTLLLLLGLSLLLGRFFNGPALTTAELLVIYVMVNMVSTISGATMMTSLIGTLAHPFWYATPENEWRQLFWQHIPSWFTVSDTEILRGYFEGDTTFHTARYLRAWTVPVLVWSGFTLLLYGSLLCLSSLLRKQWTENEKLSYPIVQLPLAMATDRSFFSSRLMWTGFAISASIRIFAALHDFIPVLPQIPYGYRLDVLFTSKPWNTMGFLWMSTNLAIVGLTYFIPLDLSFSCWFFFWLTRGERVLGSMMGWRSLYLDERASGAWIGICLIAIWVSRRHFVAIGKHLLGRIQMDESREPASYRTMLLLFIISLAGLLLFCYVAGMSLWVALIFYALFYLLAIALGRVRAELGPPYHELIRINPRQLMVGMFGSRVLGARNLTVMTFLYGFNRCNRAHPMPAQLESLKIGERTGMKSSKLVMAMAVAIGVGAIATFWSYLWIAYHYGVSTHLRGWIRGSGWESFNPLQNWLQYSQGTDFRFMGFMGGGLAFVFFLYMMRTRFLWWPLHASGYVLSGASWGGMIYFWFPVMVSWLVKFLLLKYGGIGTYRKAIPFFLGLILGEYLPRSLFSILSLALDLHMPSKVAGITGW